MPFHSQVMADRRTSRGKRKSQHDGKEVTKRVKTNDSVVKTAPTDSIFHQDVSLNAISRAFHLKVSEEFVLFYRFCLSLNDQAPLDAFLKSLDLRLVGPFEVIHRNGVLPEDIDELTMCYRYFHDPPEMVTIMVGPKGWHLGYFSDFPNEEPSLIVESESEETGILKICGISLFAVVKSLLSKKEESKELLSRMEQFLSKINFTPPKSDDVIKRRKKSRVCPTLNGIGLLIALQGDVGYRPLNVTYGQLSSYLQSVVEAKTEDAELSALEPIDELVTCAQFACDEGDFGQAIDLGLSMLAFHPRNVPVDRANIFNSRIKHLLSVGYELANRSEFARIIVKHMENRLKIPRSMT